MKRAILLFSVVSLLLFCTSKVTYGQDNLKIWNEFVDAVKKGEISADKIRTYNNLPKEMLLQWAKMMKEGTLWEKIEGTPEVYKVGNHIHCIVTFADKDGKSTFCHTFLIEDDKWYFRHLENIIIRLDKIPPLPTSQFPNLPEDTKAWQREEGYWSEQVRLFNFLAKEKGKDFAFNWFKDGRGYLLAAKTWVPFYPPQKAFILYLCWEQANLIGNKPPRDNYVVLEKLEDNQAVVRMKLMYFDLYKVTGHLKQQIFFDDYKKIFETIWQDRADKAGWKLDITYKDDECIFNFKKKT
jgi:hypothetical protein